MGKGGTKRAKLGSTVGDLYKKRDKAKKERAPSLGPV